MLLDLSKAYDCLDRHLLLSKLERYGVRGNAKNWIASYLDDRRQVVQVTKNREKYLSTANRVGIAQGSILGSVLFIIFINDISSLSSPPHRQIINYADDTTLIAGGKKK